MDEEIKPLPKLQKARNRRNASMPGPDRDEDGLTYVEKYKNMMSWADERYWSDAFVEKLALDLMAWSENPESFRLTQFLGKIGMVEMDFYRICERHPNLKLARAYAIDRLAERRERNALDGTWNAGFVQSTFHAYCNTRKAAMAYTEKLKSNPDLNHEELIHCLEDILGDEFREAMKEKYGHVGGDSSKDKKV